jgi:hypothetical protein
MSACDVFALAVGDRCSPSMDDTVDVVGHGAGVAEHSAESADERY